MSEELLVIDLHFQDTPLVIASYLLPSDEGWILVESGPHSCWERVNQEFSRLGIKPAEVRHVLLTHIHLDHAGAAWAFADSGATIHVHPAGTAHLADPSKLLASASRIYGDQMDKLWGDIRPIAPDRIHAVEDQETLRIGQRSFRSLHTPGHARHHIAWEWGDVIFTGDVAGIRIGAGIAAPPCPPPEFDLEAWRRSLDILRRSDASQLALTHFGLVNEKAAHLDELERGLETWVSFFHRQPPDWDRETLTSAFMEFIHSDFYPAEMDNLLRSQYDYANPPWMSVEGITRYLAKAGR